MKNIKIENIENIQLNNKIIDIFKNHYKSEISLKAWSFLYETLLSLYNIDLSLEEILYNEYNKPYLKSNKIHFNISHSKSMVAIIISDSCCGIDIQKVNITKDINKYISKILSEDEINEYEKSINKLEYFYEIWTKKEAYYKQKGTGIILSSLKNKINYKDIITKKINENDEIYFISYL